jgi:hypothetical protein
MNGAPARWLGHVVTKRDAGRYIGRRCAHCGGEYDSVEEILRIKPKYAGKAGVVCSACWREWVLSPRYRKNCGVG